MSKATRDDNRFEHLLREARLPGPSRELKARVTDAATNAWKETSVGISWWVPLRRLAVSAAAAVVIVSLADYVSGRMTAMPQSRDVRATAREPAEIDALPEVVDGSLVRRLAAAGGRRPATDVSQLREHLEKVRRMLGAGQGDDLSERPPAIEGSSRRGEVVLRSFS